MIGSAEESGWRKASSLFHGRDIYDFTGKTVLQAVQEQDPRPYIHAINETLHILPAEDFLSGLGMWLHREYLGDYRTALRTALDVVNHQYDYILIDLPPNLGEQTINGLCASDEAVISSSVNRFAVVHWIGMWSLY